MDEPEYKPLMLNSHSQTLYIVFRKEQLARLMEEGEGKGGEEGRKRVGEGAGRKQERQNTLSLGYFYCIPILTITGDTLTLSPGCR